MYNDVYQCQPISIVSILLYLALRPPHDPQTSCAQLLMTWIFPWFPSCFRPCEGDSHNPCFLLVKFNHEICIDMHRYAVELADSLASSKTGQIQNHQPPTATGRLFAQESGTEASHPQRVGLAKAPSPDWWSHPVMATVQLSTGNLLLNLEMF